VAKDAYRKANPTKDKEYSARKRAEDPAKKSADSLEYRLKYPKKVKAHRAINNGIRDGKVFKGSECEACGSTGLLNGHHDDYDKPFIVRWLCSPCHGAWHELNGEAANAT
jgi:ribosomal protein S27AE